LEREQKDHSAGFEMEVSKQNVSVHSYIPLKEITRTGGREVTLDEIKDVETLIKNFNYKAVEYGNWVKDDEARFHVSNFIAAMKDLEDVLGIKIADLNKFGKLSIAFGSRGIPRMMAHYDLRRRLINLTKMVGDGSVAHEFGHFLDHIFSKGSSDVTMLSGGDEAYRNKAKADDTDVQLASVAVMQAIVSTPSVVYKNFPIPSEEEAEKTGRKRFVETLQRNYETLDKVLEYLSRYAPEDNIYSAVAFMFKQELKNVPYRSKFTQYYNRVDNIRSASKRRYLRLPTEMFARAFEAYIYDKLEENGMKNDYLVARNLLERGEAMDDEHYWLQVYPQ